MLFTKKNEPSAAIPAPASVKPAAPAAPAEARDAKAERGAVNQNASTMHPHLSFEGNLKYAGRLTIDCDFKGSIQTADLLSIGPAAVVQAEISAGVVEVSGKVHGNIKARTRVKIVAGGEVYGNVETPNLSMEDGVVFEGNCTRPAGGPASASQQAPAPAASAARPQLRPREGAPAAAAPVAAAAPRAEPVPKLETTI